MKNSEQLDDTSENFNAQFFNPEWYADGLRGT